MQKLVLTKEDIPMQFSHISCNFECRTGSNIYSRDRRQSKTLRAISECRSKTVRNRVFDCHFAPDWPQVAIENTVSIFFLSVFVDC